MPVQIKEASEEQKPVFERLVQLYVYDFSEIEGYDVNSDGLFDWKVFAFDSYWTEPGRVPFLIYVDDNIAGFALVNSFTCLDENRGGKSIAEFFIMHKYRRQGIGRQAAFHVFDRFPGTWEVRQIQSNVAGQAFWRSVIGEYTAGRFEETVLDTESWRGPIQSFSNSK